MLDPEQNNTFSDHYLEVPFDLSQVLFITTANLLDPIPAPLRDRMEIIEVTGYTEDEKLEIARRFLLPKAARSARPDGRAASRSPTTPAAPMIRDYTRESGVRDLEREIGALCRKVARKLAGDDPSASCSAIDGRHDRRLPRRAALRATTMAEEEDEIGVATGAAYTGVGGDLLGDRGPAACRGQGRPVLTGQLGDVMKESARAAISYARSRADALGLSRPASSTATDPRPRPGRRDRRRMAPRRASRWPRR